MKFSDLVGKTISEAVLLKCPGLDDEAWLRLRFTDGTECVLEATYGGFTGNSVDEYPSFLVVRENPLPSDLVPAKAE
jgi:hypothetical protein